MSIHSLVKAASRKGRWIYKGVKNAKITPIVMAYCVIQCFFCKKYVFCIMLQCYYFRFFSETFRLCGHGDGLLVCDGGIQGGHEMFP